MRKTKSTAVERASKANRQAGRDAYVTDLRDGRRPNRPTTIPDRRKVASKQACRKGVSW